MGPLANNLTNFDCFLVPRKPSSMFVASGKIISRASGIPGIANVGDTNGRPKAAFRRLQKCTACHSTMQGLPVPTEIRSTSGVSCRVTYALVASPIGESIGVGGKENVSFDSKDDLCKLSGVNGMVVAGVVSEYSAARIMSVSEDGSGQSKPGGRFRPTIGGWGPHCLCGATVSKPGGQSKPGGASAVRETGRRAGSREARFEAKTKRGSNKPGEETSDNSCEEAAGEKVLNTPGGQTFGRNGSTWRRNSRVGFDTRGGETLDGMALDSLALHWPTSSSRNSGSGVACERNPSTKYGSGIVGGKDCSATPHQLASLESCMKQVDSLDQ